ncbi:hypothetical protein QVN24_15380 [Yersinia ruckeri]|uniref:hypothetical protein n=1 Tax=Yersinia ruckeri TaxID=29486 RepID=UPI0008FE8A36|nr:hypothetical protein [Yersinia ruckeri]EKN4198504.1 hypothetical protein [Yersinia ruckeri]EKN4702320.1 hypothetical protein [Yersinia ruckeri]MCW6524881.1 hypothetical protein [Yersinia ruckeri]MCW6605387.1 hypothetical protein [Yersinia ruckeri]MDN0092385.1 hypothetical protein [Yersinia ruckeri]
MSNNIFQLASIIKAAGSDPGDIATSIWAAHYRKPARNADEVTDLTLSIICNYCMDFLPPEVWPGTLDGVLKFELGVFVKEQTYLDVSQPAKIAKAVLAAGYRLDKHAAKEEADEMEVTISDMMAIEEDMEGNYQPRDLMQSLYMAGYRKGTTHD